MQIIRSGVDGIKVQLWEAITRYRTPISENGLLRAALRWGCSCENHFVSKGGTLPLKGSDGPDAAMPVLRSVGGSTERGRG